MSSAPASASQAADLLQKLSLDSQSKTSENLDSTKKPTVDSGNVSNVQIQSSDRSVTPLIPDSMDPAMWYSSGYAPYYYGGYDGTGNEWGDYSRYFKPDGVDMSQGVYGGYGYAPYGPYSPAGTPVPAIGHDGQLYGAQQYQYPTSYFQPLNPTSGPSPTPVAPAKGENSTVVAADQSTLSVETPNGKCNGTANGSGTKGNKPSAALKTAHQNSAYSSYNANSSYGRGSLAGVYPTSYDGLRSTAPWIDGRLYSDARTTPFNSTSITQSASGNGITGSKNRHARPQLPYTAYNNPRPLSGINTANGYMNRMYPNKLYNQNGLSYRSGFYGSNVYDSRTIGRGWFSVDTNYKSRGRGNGFLGYGNENMDGLNELNRGPRSKSFKNQKGAAPVESTVKGQDNLVTGTNGNVEENPSECKGKEQYNKADFPVTYTDAKFFIIKSYSEDDVHKSIKYNAWSSTQNGNKKLHAAYQEAQQNTGNCPIFLFFSVNTSGQFVGVAEMLGPVDFDKNLEYWQQDKWVGCFPVRWHIVKDVPNTMLKHITLENNENKPVTNSRDTQEVKIEQGLQLLKIFKDYSTEQSILDDFEFYEDRQKRIQEKKTKQQLLQKQSRERKPDDETKEGPDVEVTNQKSIGVSLNITKDAAPTVLVNGDVKMLENGSIVKAHEIPKVSKTALVTAEGLVPNRVANGI